MGHKIVEAILRELRTRRAQLSDAVASNGAKNFEDYKLMCGEIRGLTAVESYLLDLAKSMEQFDE